MRRLMSQPFSLIAMLYVWSWVLVAAAASAAAALQLLHPMLSSLLIFPASALVLLIWSISKRVGWFAVTAGTRPTRPQSSIHHPLTPLERVALLLLALIWLSHVIQVLVPETGFDAVWYHLPVLQLFVTHHGLVTNHALYQTLNPLFADLAFLPGFIGWGDVGTKITAFGGGLALICAAYAVARILVSRTWSLLTICLVSTFQVVAWQAASFYIDMVVATFFLGATWHLLSGAPANTRHRQRLHLLLAGLLVGAAIGSKQFDIIMLVPYLLAAMMIELRSLNWLLFLLTTLVFALPWYMRAWLATGDALFSVNLHLRTLTTTNESSTASYLLQRTLLLPFSYVKVGWIRDYLSPLLWFTPVATTYLLIKKKWTKHHSIIALIISAQWLVWWYTPPLSTRYALAGFVLAVILIAAMVEDCISRHYRSRTYIIGCWLLLVAVNLVPRWLVNYRSLTYLLGHQTKAQYLQQFYDGNIDEKLQQWHRLPHR